MFMLRVIAVGAAVVWSALGAGVVPGDAKRGEELFQSEQSFKRIAADKDTKVQVLRMWDALAPYDVEIQKNLEATLNPEGWGGVAGAPAYLMLQAKLAEQASPFRKNLQSRKPSKLRSLSAVSAVSAIWRP